MNALATRILGDFEAHAALWPATADEAGARLRAALAAGLPTSRDENWRYAALRGLERLSFRPAPPPDEAQLRVAGTLLPERRAGRDRIVFVNGHFVPSLSDQIRGESGGAAVVARGAAPALRTCADELDFRYAIVNEAFAPAPLIVDVHGGAHSSIEICALTTLAADAGAVYPRLVLRAREAADLSIVERHLSTGESTALTNVAVEIEAGPNARIRHVRLQQHGEGSQFVETLRAEVAADANYELTQLSLGGRAARTTAGIGLRGRGAHCSLGAVAIADGARTLDAFFRIEHLAPHTRTVETVRGIAADRARVAFNGLITMAQGAVGAESEQSLRGLLSGTQCEIDLRPQLEIYVDAVKASHGATTGKLDEQMLFYLLSRGLDRVTAQALLKWAFVEDVLRDVGERALRHELEREIAARLGDVPLASEAA